MVEHRLAETDVRQECGDAFFNRLVRSLDAFPVADDLAQRRAYRHSRIERAYCVLKNHLHRFRGHLDFSRAFLLDSDEGFRDGRLSASRLADDTYDFAFVQMERDAFYGFEFAVFHVQVGDFKKVHLTL